MVTYIVGVLVNAVNLEMVAVQRENHLKSYLASILVQIKLQELYLPRALLPTYWPYRIVAKYFHGV